MENREYKIAFVEDMLFNLVVNRTTAIYPEKGVVEEDRDWFNVAIREADIKIKESIEFLLFEEESCDSYKYDPLCYSLKQEHKLHHVSLPVNIENALVAFVCDKWASDNGLKIKHLSEEALSNLKSCALKRHRKPYRKYDI